MPRLLPEAHDQNVQQIVDKYTSEILQQVADLPIEEAEEPVPDAVIDSIVGSSELVEHGQPTYWLESDTSARVYFRIEGNVKVFQEVYRSFFGSAWTLERGVVSIPIKGSRDPRTVRAEVASVRGELGRVLAAFKLAHAGARAQLLALANNACVARKHLEEILIESGFKKEPPLPL